MTLGVTGRWLSVNAERVIDYIGGCKLYDGLREARLQSSRRLLDHPAMCRALLKGGQQLDLGR